MNTRQTLESMLDTIARTETRDQSSIAALFADPKPVTVHLGAKGVALALGKSVSILTTADGEINSGTSLPLGSIAPIKETFVLGETAGAVDPVALVVPSMAETVAPVPAVDPGVVVVEGDLPRRKRENGKVGEPVAP